MNNYTKWYAVEIPYYSQELIKRAENFQSWLCDNNMCYRVSSLSSIPLYYIKFEISATYEQLKLVLSALDTLVWVDK